MNIPFYYFYKRNLPIHIYAQIEHYGYMMGPSLRILGFTESMRIIRREIKIAKESNAPFLSVDRVANIIFHTAFEEVPEWREKLRTVD